MILPAICFVTSFLQSHGQIISSTPTAFDLTAASIIVDENDFILIKKAANLLQQDIEAVTGKRIPIHHSAKKTTKNKKAASISEAAFHFTLFYPMADHSSSKPLCHLANYKHADNPHLQ